MITLKTWNSLPLSKREKVVRLIFGEMPEWWIKNMAKEWRHSIDTEHRVLLSSIYTKRRAGKDIGFEVRVEV